MYEIALTVTACLRSGTRVDVAWVLESDLSSADGELTVPGDSLALTPGGGRVGSLCAGALDDQVGDRARTMGGGSGRVVRLTVGDLEARAFGLAGPGTATCVVAPANLLPDALWPRLLDGETVAIQLDRSGDEVTDATLLDELPAEPDKGSAVEEDQIVTVFRPVPTLVLAGGGPVLAALGQLARPLGWRCQHAASPDSASALVVGLGPLDMVVLAMHDTDLAGPVLAATLSGRAGYVAALGSRTMQASRETWLADRGLDGLERIHTPAGLAIGADGPAEVAVAILAQAIAVRAESRAQAQAIA